MKVAFIIPFAFERFFHDAKSLFSNPEKFEDEIIIMRKTWHFNWCLALKEAGIDVTVFHISSHAKTIREYYHNTGIRIIRVPTDFRGLISKEEYSFRLLSEIKRYKPDIIFSITHMLNALVDMHDILVIQSKLMGVGVVSRNPGADLHKHIFSPVNSLRMKYSHISGFMPFIRLLTLAKLSLRFFLTIFKFFIKSLSLRISDTVIPQTLIDKQNLIKKFKVSRNAILMLPKPVELKCFYEMSRNKAAKHIELDTSFRYLLHVSNLFNTKGCEHIIQALPELIEKHPNIILIVTGNGSEREKLEIISNNLGLSPYVNFVGHIEKEILPYYFNIADAFVLPTEIEDEGGPNVLLEAIACNTPPITSNYPGPKAIVTSGLGIVIDPQKRNELIAAIKTVLSRQFIIDPDQREKFLKLHSFQNTGNILKNNFKVILSK